MIIDNQQNENAPRLGGDIDISNQPKFNYPDDYFDGSNNLCLYTGEPYNIKPLVLNRLYYSIEQAAAKLQCSVRDLLHYGATGQVDFVFLPPMEVVILAVSEFNKTPTSLSKGRTTALFLSVNELTMAELEARGKASILEASPIYDTIFNGKMYKLHVAGYLHGDETWYLDEYESELKCSLILDKAVDIHWRDLIVLNTEIQRLIKGTAKEAPKTTSTLNEVRVKVVYDYLMATYGLENIKSLPNEAKQNAREWFVGKECPIDNEAKTLSIFDTAWKHGSKSNIFALERKNRSAKAHKTPAQ